MEGEIIAIVSVFRIITAIHNLQELHISSENLKALHFQNQGIQILEKSEKLITEYGSGVSVLVSISKL